MAARLLSVRWRDPHSGATRSTNAPSARIGRNHV